MNYCEIVPSKLRKKKQLSLVYENMRLFANARVTQYYVMKEMPVQNDVMCKNSIKHQQL